MFLFYRHNILTEFGEWNIEWEKLVRKNKLWIFLMYNKKFCNAKNKYMEIENKKLEYKWVQNEHK